MEGRSLLHEMSKFSHLHRTRRASNTQLLALIPYSYAEWFDNARRHNAISSCMRVSRLACCRYSDFVRD